MFDLKYEHIHLIHTDHDAAVRFYRDALGAEIINSVERFGAPQTKLDCHGTMLIVRGVRDGEDPMAAGSVPRMGADHFGFWIGRGRYGEAKAHLEGLGVKIAQEGDLPHLRFLYFEGPDGVIIEFMDPKE
ncbi:MAG: VOC family protein [Nitrospinota bacterium]|nr:VOC family protein [Nitrospinota bacterium]MDP7662985.1 VOC family protein [Nitrospinota bacterium]